MGARAGDHRTEQPVGRPLAQQRGSVAKPELFDKSQTTRALEPRDSAAALSATSSSGVPSGKPPYFNDSDRVLRLRPDASQHERRMILHDPYIEADNQS